MEISVSDIYNEKKSFPIHEEIDFLRMTLQEVRNWPINFLGVVGEKEHAIAEYPSL